MPARGVVLDVDVAGLREERRCFGRGAGRVIFICWVWLVYDRGRCIYRATTTVQRKRGTLTYFLWGEHSCAVLGAGLVQEVRVAAGALARGEHGVRGVALVVDDDEEGYGDEDNERSSERQHGEQAGGVAGERDAGDQGVEEGAESKGCQGKGRRRPAVRWPVQRCCFQSGLECSTAADSGHKGVERNHAHGHGLRSAVVGCEGQL